MRYIVVILVAICAIFCGGTVVPVFEYDVPVASQPIVYAPHPHAVHPYAVRTPPAVNVFGPPQYNYAPLAATSRVEQSRLIVPQIYHYQQYNSPPPAQQYNNQASNRNIQEQGTGQNRNRKVYANEMPYTNNGEQVKLRRYQIHRPGIKKEFYDVEERVIVRPVGSALIEFNSPTKKQEINENNENGRNYASNYNQYNFQGFRPSNNNNNNQYSSNGYGQHRQYFPTAVPDCGYLDQQPVYVYNAPPQPFLDNNPQYHPTTFVPPTTTDNFHTTKGYPTTKDNYPSTNEGSYPTTKGIYPTTVYSIPSQTYLPPVIPDQSYSPSSSSEYAPTTAYGSTSAQYAPSTASSTVTQGTTPKQSDIYISSTTPISVTIVDKNEDANKNLTNLPGQDIIYAEQYEENTPDQVQNELPPRGDVSQYRAEQPDQFYYELPSSRYTNEPNRPPQAFNVYTKSNGEPDTFNGYDQSIIIESKDRNSTKNRNQTSFENNQQAQLIELYTGNGGISEDQSKSRYTNDNNQNTQYKDVGNVRARVVSVTPPPATAIPTETVNKRRIVFSKPVTTVQEVVEADNSTSGQYQQSNNYESPDGNNYSSEFNDNKNRANNNYDSTRANYETKTPSTSSTGVFISTTPSTASQRIIYVQPVSQDFAQQKAVPPKSN
ncbi:myb-like protein A isoform X2 [Contarinia nasturtii]|uniref:myb-like protein A isoform X2 n=1 Tax=Contarinia nasturtii TaxID=265458 RepID=UPI0012D47AED|nr:myb-like protein A isoform X2 [Contarinia nasturtii]